MRLGRNFHNILFQLVLLELLFLVFERNIIFWLAFFPRNFLLYPSKLMKHEKCWTCWSNSAYYWNSISEQIYHIWFQYQDLYWLEYLLHFFQGSSLTTYELVHDHIPVVLIADSVAATLQKSGHVDAIVVGADRIVANGM